MANSAKIPGDADAVPTPVTKTGRQHNLKSVPIGEVADRMPAFSGEAAPQPPGKPIADAGQGNGPTTVMGGRAIG